MRTAVITALILAAPLPAAAQGIMYRCQAPGGELSFQQLPCAPGTRGQAIAAREVPVTTMGDNILALVQRNSQTRGQLTEADMVQQLGYPSGRNVDVFDGVATVQHVYRYPDGSARYVYTRDGVVIGAQVREGRRNR